MAMIAYQALLSRPDNVARIQSAKPAIERAGGSVTITHLKTGMAVVVLQLPDIYTPDQFLPGIPFYPA